ncbi:MAG: hypothetical protein V4469_01570 [Patescibacteria group bacterium]
MDHRNYSVGAYRDLPPGWTVVAGHAMPPPVFSRDIPSLRSIEFFRKLVAASPSNLPKASANGQTHNTE